MTARVVLVPASPGAWQIALVDGTVVGTCWWRPAGEGVAEICYELAAGFRGQGYGGEAVAALTERLDGEPGIGRVTAEVHVGNLASRRLLERLGFRLDAVEQPYLTYGFARFKT